MPEVYTIPLSKIIHELQLETAFLPKSADDILIQSRDVVRPGMELNGYHEYFDPNRIAVLGRAEMYMLESLKPERRAMALDSYLSLKPPAVIVARGIDPGKDFMEIAETYHVPVLRTTESTSNVVASLVAYLNVELAPRITRHGVLVEVYGEGILLVGDIRHFIELRGIGIINARRIFGMGAVKLQEKIDMCINLEIWDATKVYDRMGMDSEYTEILGIKVPVMTIPVKPGRNLAIIIEVAAMNNRQKKMGYNAAYELLSALGMDASMMPHEEIKRDLDI